LKDCVLKVHFITVIGSPCLATITLETASGTLVPAARNVIPITESGIFRVSPEEYQKKFISISVHFFVKK